MCTANEVAYFVQTTMAVSSTGSRFGRSLPQQLLSAACPRGGEELCLDVGVGSLLPGRPLQAGEIISAPAEVGGPGAAALHGAVWRGWQLCQMLALRLAGDARPSMEPFPLSHALGADGGRTMWGHRES
jgi:hypothetical protein